MSVNRPEDELGGRLRTRDSPVLTGCGTLAPPVHQCRPPICSGRKVFLAAGDYRRAVEACRQEVQEHPSARSYLYLTYVYQALDAYVEFWRNGSMGGDGASLFELELRRAGGAARSPNVLARIAKEMIQAQHDNRQTSPPS